MNVQTIVVVHFLAEDGSCTAYRRDFPGGWSSHNRTLDELLNGDGRGGRLEIDARPKGAECAADHGEMPAKDR